MASRSAQRAQEAIDSIRKELGDDKAQIEFLELDLMDLQAVKAAADQFLSLKLPLHILVNNAGGLV
jgi:NAD(P)-dependent dehydrogenase (short-subunit alcohol dehydrogenase family)